MDNGLNSQGRVNLFIAPAHRVQPNNLVCHHNTNFVEIPRPLLFGEEEDHENRECPRQMYQFRVRLHSKNEIDRGSSPELGSALNLILAMVH